MGNSKSANLVPKSVDRKAFHDLCQKHGPGRVDDSVFTNLCGDDGTITRERLSELFRLTDAMMSYESGIDAHGRYNQDRVKQVAKFLRERGFLVWLGDDEAKRFGCIFDPKERSREGIENTQVVLVFVTKRYSDLLERHLHAHVNINLDSGAGSAGGDTSELCGFEFEYALGFRGSNYLRALVPCAMENNMTDKRNWGPRLREALGQRFLVDLSNFEADPEALPAFSDFLRSAVGSPLLQGGPFIKNKNAELTSTRGRHFHWLREKCSFTQKKASMYADVFVAHNIVSSVRLFNCIELNARYLVDVLKIDDAVDAAILAGALSADVRGNIDRENQDKIDVVMCGKKAVSAAALDLEVASIQNEKAWVGQVHEDEEMRAEDRCSKQYFFNSYMENVIAGSKASSAVRLEEAVQFDAVLREGELMLRQDILAGSIKYTESQRRKALADMCTLVNPSSAAAHVRRVAGVLHVALKHSVPSRQGDSQAPHAPQVHGDCSKTTGKGPRDSPSVVGSSVGGCSPQADKAGPLLLVDQPKDTNWHRLLEEVVHALVMVKRVCFDKPEVQRMMTDKGVLKVLLLLLYYPCTNTSNLFVVPDTKTLEALHPHDPLRPLLLKNYFENVSSPNASLPTTTSVSIAGVDAVRYLCRCRDDSTDMTGNNDRNVFLLGQAGAIEIVLGIIKQHLWSIKQGASPESVQRSTRAVYAALECIFAMAGRSIDHPNKVRFAQARAFEVLLMCSHNLQDSPTVFRWVGKLVVLLFTEKTDIKVHGRLCKMITGSLRRFVEVAGSCTGGCIAVSHLSFVSALVELLAPAVAHAVTRRDVGSKGRGGGGGALTGGSGEAQASSSFLASIQNSLSYWLRERGAAQLCLECIQRHYRDPAEGPPLVSSAARAIGNLCYRNQDNKHLFLDPANVQVLIDAAAFHRGTAFVIAELMFAFGNAVDLVTSSFLTTTATSAPPGAQARASVGEEGETLAGSSPAASTAALRPLSLSPPRSPPAPARGAPIQVPESPPVPSLNTQIPTVTAATLLVSRGAVELIQSALVEHRGNADCCLCAIHAFGKLLHGALAARNLTLVQRIICIGTCDQVCKAMAKHPDRLDIFTLGCQALQTIITSPYDDITQGTQRILNAQCCQVVNLGIRTATSALVNLFSRPSVVQSPDISMADEAIMSETTLGGATGTGTGTVARHDPLLYSGAAFFTGCRTIHLMLTKSIRRASFLQALEKHGLLQTITSAPVARVRAMILQVKACHDLGQVGGNIVLGQAMVFVQAACDVDQLTPEQKAQEASSNNPSCYPRRVEFFELVSAEDHVDTLSSLFDTLGLDYPNWVEGKS